MTSCNNNNNNIQITKILLVFQPRKQHNQYKYVDDLQFRMNMFGRNKMNLQKVFKQQIVMHTIGNYFSHLQATKL